MPLLTLTDIRKSFGGVRALAGVNLELQRGSITALLGENGAGKSTLVKILSGVHQPTPATFISTARSPGFRIRRRHATSASAWYTRNAWCSST